MNRSTVELSEEVLGVGGQAFPQQRPFALDLTLNDVDDWEPPPGRF